MKSILAKTSLINEVIQIKEHSTLPDFNLYFRLLKNKSDFTTEKEKLLYYFNYLFNNGYDHEASVLINYMLKQNIISNPVYYFTTDS
ncbi:MAG: hypothetical protein R6W68_00390 [Ignavibacteriaceae bacterium]